MSDNPFSEPEDADRTIIRGPQPRAGATPPPPRPVAAWAGAPAPAASLPAAVAREVEALPKVGISPLTAAAAPLLELLAQLTNMAQVARPDELRERAIRALRQFEADARAADISPDSLRAAHYALCAALDDVALATPWGPPSVWGAQSLVSTFHQEVRSGERFFDLLAGMQRDPGRYLPALEVAYLVMALGMQGRYRLARGGGSELDRLREGLFQLLAQLRGPWERELSPRWRGVDAPHRPARRGVSAWIAVPLALALLGIGYAYLSRDLNQASDDLYARLAALPPATQQAIARTAPPVPPAPPPAPVAAPRPSLADRLRQFLAPEIAQGLVAVSGDVQRTLVRIKGTGMYASGSATLNREFEPLLARIGEAVKEEDAGRTDILGHSDNQPIRTVRFPSNFHLSQARAEAAMEVIQRAAGLPAERFHAEGRGETEPVADNRTAEGREANRRIEVLVLNRRPG